MASINWLKQTENSLFPDLLWSRPENKRHAGKLLIIGGNSHGFLAVGATFSAAQQAGAGSVRVVLPNSLEKTLRKTFPEAEFAPSTPSGSFARLALDTALKSTEWADGVLLAGNFGKNSETSIFIESFLDKYSGPLCVAGDSLDYFLQNPSDLTHRTNTTICATISQLQKIAHPQVVIKQTADLIQILDVLSIYSTDINASIVTQQANQIIVAYQAKISTTSIDKEVALSDIAAYTSVWQIQQPGKAFEALCTAVYDFVNK